MRDEKFIEKYLNLRTRLAPFKLREDVETKKTVAAALALLHRAETVNAGASVTGRFNFTEGHTVENYISRAESYISALERGEFPLRGKYAEIGSQVVDHSFIVKDDELHLIYIRGGDVGYEWDMHPVDTVDHSVTTDLLNWKRLPSAVTTDVSMHENYQVWAPGVAEKDGVYYLYYTGVNTSVAQAICLATSDDLITWKKYENNPIVFPGEWGEWSADRWSDCRDPMVFVDDDGKAYMYFCTTKRDGEGKLSPALGVASSTDMIHWEDEGAYCFDICDITLESPFVIKREGKYYLFYTNCGHGTAYAVSDNPISGWQSLGMLIENPKGYVPVNPANVPSCAEVFCFKGKWYISSCLREPGCEQYLEIFELFWNGDGTVRVGKRIE